LQIVQAAEANPFAVVKWPLKRRQHDEFAACHIRATGLHRAQLQKENKKTKTFPSFFRSQQL